MGAARRRAAAGGPLAIFLAGTILALAGWPRPAVAQWRDAAAAVVMGAASGLDIASTFACNNPARCAEGNPLAALFYDPEHPGWLIAADVVAVAGVTLVGYELRRSSSRTVRRLWWLPAAVFTAASFIQWRSNVRELARCPECRR